MNIFRSLMAIMAIATSSDALAEELDLAPGTETVTTTKTIGRVDEDGSTKPLEKEVKTQTLIDIPVATKAQGSSNVTTVPCQDLPPIVTPTEEFIENNADDDSDIAAEAETEVLVNDKGEVGYALDEVPAELLEENPVNPDEIAKIHNEEIIKQEIEESVDEALDDEEIKQLIDSRDGQSTSIKPAPRVIDPKNDAETIKP